MVVQHFEAISELCAKSKLFDRVRNVWLTYNVADSNSDKLVGSLVDTPA